MKSSYGKKIPFLIPQPVIPKNRQIFTSEMLKAMILPLFIEQVLQLFVGLADTLMVSYAGEEVVSGVSLDTMIYTIFIYLFTAVASGGAVVVSQYLGREDREKASLAASQIYTIAAFISIFCCVTVLVGCPAILRMLYPRVDPNVMKAAETYFKITALSFPANAVYNSGAAIYRSMGKTRTTMVVSGAMNILNIAGNAIGIFLLHAGAKGVAWPTTISWYFAAVVMTILCFTGKNKVKVKTRLIFSFDRKTDRQILKIAIPTAIENVLFQLAKVVLGALVATFGTAQIAANGIAQTVWAFAATMNMTMSPVFTTVIGYCMGRGDTDAANWYIRRLLRISMILCFSWNVIVTSVFPLLLPLYQVSAEAKRYVWIIVLIHNSAAAVTHPYFSPLSSGLRATGDAKFAMWSSIFATVVCRTFFSFLLGLRYSLGVIGVTISMVIDWTIKGTLDIWRWKSGKWKKNKVI